MTLCATLRWEPVSTRFILLILHTLIQVHSSLLARCGSFFHAHGFFDRSNEQSQLRNLLRLLEMLIPEEAPAPPQIAVSDSKVQYASSVTLCLPFFSVHLIGASVSLFRASCRWYCISPVLTLCSFLCLSSTYLIRLALC